MAKNGKVGPFSADPLSMTRRRLNDGGGEAETKSGGAMTKSDLVRLVAEEKKLSKGRAEALVNGIFDCIEDSLKRDERVEIRGIGSFETRRYGAYKGRNPRTGVSVAVRPKRLPFFKVGKGLKDLINDRLTRTQEMPAVEDVATSQHGPARAQSRSA
jgi:integration host factor subunit beta